MTIFCIVEPEYSNYKLVDAPSMDSALELAGLQSGRLDHGVLIRAVPTQDSDEPPFTIALFAYEFGLYQRDTHYWTVPVSADVYCGNTVLYEATIEGDTIDFKHPDVLKGIKFYHGHEQLERAIQANKVRRPKIAINGLVVWEWPNPPDPNIEALMRRHGTFDRIEPDKPAEAQSE